MKSIKTLLIVILVVISISGFSQISPNKIFIEGSFSYSSSTYDSNKSLDKRDFKINPSLGYTINDKMQVGFGFGFKGSIREAEKSYSSYNNSYYNNYSYYNNGREEAKETEKFIYSPFIYFRYHRFIYKKIAMGFKTTMLYNIHKAKTENNQENDYDTDGVELSLSPEIMVLLTNKLGVKMSIGYIGASSSTGANVKSPSRTDFVAKFNTPDWDFGLFYFF